MAGSIASDLRGLERQAVIEEAASTGPFLTAEELKKRDEADFEAGRWPYSPHEAV